MTIVKISPHENGGHDNQTINGVTPETFPVPDGYAVIPEELGSPETLENYPFGEIVTGFVNDVPTVMSWTPLPMPEPEPGPQEPEYTELQLLGQQLTDHDLRLIALESGNV